MFPDNIKSFFQARRFSTHPRSDGFQFEKTDGKTLAEIYYTAFTENGANSKNRPITFAFNGGPGSPSYFLQLGGFGPQRVDLGADGTALPPGGSQLVTNEESLLDLSDIVFIDPVQTGYSRVIDNDAAYDKKFFSTTHDAASICEGDQRVPH